MIKSYPNSATPYLLAIAIGIAPFPYHTQNQQRHFMKRLYNVVYLKDTRSYARAVVKLLIVRVPAKPVTSMMASVVALNPAVASLIATKLRLPKVN